MNKKELEDAYRRGKVVDVLYAYVTGSITDKAAKKDFEKHNLEYRCMYKILSELNNEDVTEIIKRADNVEDLEYCEYVWHNFVENPKMETLANYYVQINQAYYGKLERVKKSKEMVINMQKDKTSSFYETGAFLRLPDYFYDKSTMLEVIKNLKYSDFLIETIKNKNPELFKDPEVVAELIMLVSGPWSIVEELIIEVPKDVYEEASKLVETAREKTKKQKEAQRQKEQRQKEKEIKQKKWHDIEEILSIVPDENYRGITSYRDRIYKALLYLFDHPLSIEKIVKIGYTSYEKFEELINYYNTNLDKSENNGDLDDVEKEALERAYKIYDIFKQIEEGKIKLKDIPVGYFEFDDVVERVTQIAKSKIEDKARELTKDINADDEVGKDVEKKIKINVQKAVDEITKMREVSKTAENETVDTANINI